MPLADVWHGLFHYAGTGNDVIVHDLRVPRTLLGLLVGAALGLAGRGDAGPDPQPAGRPRAARRQRGRVGRGRLRHQLPRRHLADRLRLVRVRSAPRSSRCSSTSSAAAGARPRCGSRSPGPPLTAALYGYINAVAAGTAALDRLRFWTVGSLASADMDDHPAGRARSSLVGAVLALLLARPLNALALGDDTARALGAHLNRTRALAMLAVTLLCGAATAACGPIVFVGLMVPHVVRAITGPDMRWMLPYAAVLVARAAAGRRRLGRVVARPAELQVGIVTALHRRARLHLPRPPPEDGPAVKAVQDRHRGPGRRGRAAVRTAGGSRCAWTSARSVVVVLLAAVARGRGVVLIGTGDFPIAPGEVAAARCSGNGTLAQEFIVHDLRLPRVLVGLLVGAALGLGGAIFQTLTRNPLGSPDILGFTQGATVGALVVIVLFRRRRPRSRAARSSAAW